MQNKKYKRILILGSIGSGKTTLANSIQKKKEITVYHLDKEYWLPNWTRPEHQIWEEKIARFVSEDNWVIEGNYIETLPLRLERADLVIMLDIPTRICIRGVFWRTLKGQFLKRKDLGIGCKDAFNRSYQELVKWARSFKTIYYPALMQVISQYPRVDVKIFKTRSSAKQFIERLMD
ncbi:MAG: hypothetical protein NC182_06995 [Prevotella sp.]|nr:hypothetical protein [Staphylococcus sp.]MCM1350929.1 hypothetical protein [Prevotella sp.]